MKLPAPLRNYDRPTDRPMGRPGHREVSLQIMKERYSFVIYSILKWYIMSEWITSKTQKIHN